MLTFTRHQPVSGEIRGGVRGELRLAFEWRQKSRCRVTVSRGAMAGEQVGLFLPRGTVLRQGDSVGTEDGVWLSVSAAVEQLMHVTAANSLALTRLAYHLGNRHVPVQLGGSGEQAWLRLQLDHVLEAMVVGLGGTVSVVSEPFDPEAGAYGGGHRHDDGPSAPASSPRIHDFTRDGG